MAIIATFTSVNVDKFNINGYEVFKVFNVRKIGTNTIDIVNVYDNNQELFQALRFDEVSVNGITYANVEDLITNLTPVVYRPATLGTASQQQINDIQAVIDALPTTYAGINHDHAGLYLTEQQIRNLNLGGSAGSNITSGVVLGNKIRFFDDVEQLVFEIDAKDFLSQGTLLSYNQSTGKLSLQNGFAEILSTTTIQAKNIGYDSFEYVEGIANDLSNLIVGSAFLLVQTIDGTIYFINPTALDFSEDFRLTFVNNGLKHDLTTADVSTVDYKGYILTGVDPANYQTGIDYLFTFWRKQIAQGLVVNDSDDVPEGTTNLYNTQPDWNQTTTTAPDFIKNKPTLGSLAAIDTIATTEIDDAAVTNSKLASMAENTIKGRSAGTGAPLDLTPSETREILEVSKKYARKLVSASRNLTDNDNNKTLIIDGAITLTFPATILEDFNFNFKVKVGGSLTIANGDKTLLDTTETAQTQIVAEASTFGTVYQFDTNTFIVEGI